MRPPWTGRLPPRLPEGGRERTVRGFIPPRSESLDLSNRITIEVHTASFRTVRGYTVVAALLDELAFWQGEDSSNPEKGRNHLDFGHFH